MLSAIVCVALLTHLPGLFRIGIARAGGLRIDRVVIGLLPVVKREGWVLGAIPIGTFVLIAGRDATGRANDPKLFRDRAWLLQLLIHLGGVITFQVVAALLAVVTFVAFGTEVEGHQPMVGALVAGLPAEQAGLRPGDVILRIDGKPMRETSDVGPAVNAAEIVQIDIEREGKTLTLSVKTVASGRDRRIGIEIWPRPEYRDLGFARAAHEGARFPIRQTRYLVEGFQLHHKQDHVTGAEIGFPSLGGARNTRDLLLKLATFCVYFAFWLLWPMFDGGRLVASLLRRRTTVEARDCGAVPAVKMTPPIAVILMVVIMSIALLGAVISPTTTSVRVETGVVASALILGLLNRAPSAWNLVMISFGATSLMPILNHKLLWVGVFSLVVVLSFSVRKTMQWFSLICPACNSRNGRSVLGETRRRGCLGCGSAWSIDG